MIGDRAYRDWWSTESFRSAGATPASRRYRALVEAITR